MSEAEPTHPFQPASAGDSQRLLEEKHNNRDQHCQYNRTNCYYVGIFAAILAVLLIAVMIGLGVGLGPPNTTEELPTDPHERALALLTKFPLIDGWGGYTV